jgi:hypothetical protein
MLTTSKKCSYCPPNKIWVKLMVFESNRAIMITLSPKNIMIKTSLPFIMHLDMPYQVRSSILITSSENFLTDSTFSGGQVWVIRF